MIQLFPDINDILIITPLTIFLIIIFLSFTGYIKSHFKIKTNYTRKIFHILVFTSAGVFGFIFGYSGVMFFGGLTGLIIMYIIYLGEGHILYEGIAREQDRPHRSYYIGIPFLATALGGLYNNFAFGQLAIIGYLVAGWGDAAGEPFGVKFGKHKYRVPTYRGVFCQRTVEGSLAIAFVTMIVVFLGLLLIGEHTLLKILIASVMTGVFTAGIEAISPHGLDNFTTQVTAVVICFILINFT